MSLPPEERIAVELVRRLEEVVVSQDGFSRTATVKRVNRDASDFTPENNTLVVVQGDSVRNPEMDCPGNPPAVSYQLELTVVAFIRQSDREPDADDTQSNELIALARKAIAPSNDWFTFDMGAFDAEFQDTTPMTLSNSSMAGGSFSLRVSYRVSERDPFLVR